MALLPHLPFIVAILLVLMTNLLNVPFGTFMVLGQLALIGLLAVYRRQDAIEAFLRWWPIMLLPILAILSGLWSEAPAASFRFGAQFLFTAFAGVLLAKTLSMRQLLLAVMFGYLIYSVIAHIDGTMGPSQGGMVLIGLSGSKNMFATTGLMLTISALAVLFMGRLGPVTTLTAWVGLGFGAKVAFTSFSTAVSVLTLGAAGVLIGFAIIRRLTPAIRLGALVAVVLVVAPLALMAPELQEAADTFLYETLDKDPTLSGRAALWARADALAEQRPLFGYGYQAIFMGDSTETIALQRITEVTDMRSTNFHNQFRQTMVDLGYMGIFAFVGSVALGLLAIARRVLLRPTIEMAFFFLLIVITIIRAPTEVVLGAMSTTTILFYAACVYAFREDASEEAENTNVAPSLTRSFPGRAAAAK